MGLRSFMVKILPNPLIKVFAAPYVAGDSEESAVETARWLWRKRRICSTIDMLGEDVETREGVQECLNSYHTVVDMLGRQEFATVSLKPTQFGTHISRDECEKNIASVIEKARENDLKITIDMEDHRYTSLTLEIYKSLLERFPGLGVVLQSRLHRTENDIKGLKGTEARVRICIGIYNEPPEVALQDRTDMKRKLLEYAEMLFLDGHYVEFATHDEEVVEKALVLTDRLGIKKDGFEFQMLMGVPRTYLQHKLVESGHVVRLYVPYAKKWADAVAYARRRLAANPKMMTFGIKNFFKKLSGG
ncbi:MAG: hypothetical protein GXP49_02060 [Deltaproteobacteria bacterium]|nr:hypothetical protein [Deltaproteobacteria bacterium]